MAIAAIRFDAANGRAECLAANHNGGQLHPELPSNRRVELAFTALPLPEAIGQPAHPQRLRRGPPSQDLHRLRLISPLHRDAINPELVRQITRRWSPVRIW
jgi:hypothetical protein